MAVANQTPYKEYIGNGTTKIFPLEFDCDDADHLIVKVNDIEIPALNNWSLNRNTGSVVFAIAPISQSKIILQRDTPLVRDTDYQTYNNSFKPQPVNNDFDKIWLKLQELGVTNWLTDTDIKNLSAYVNSLNDETRDEFYNNLGNLEKNTKAMLDEAIKNGAVSALAITTVNSVADLNFLNVWDGRTVKVKSYYADKDYGGATYTYNNNKWEIQPVNSTVSIEQFGAICGPKPNYTFNVFPEETTDNTNFVKAAFNFAKSKGLKLIAENNQCFFFENLATLQFYGDVEWDFNSSLFFFSTQLKNDPKNDPSVQISGSTKNISNLLITTNAYMSKGIEFNRSLSDNQGLTVKNIHAFSCRWGMSVTEGECINRIRLVNCNFTSNYYAGIYINSFNVNWSHSAPVFFRDVICNGNGPQDWIVNSDAKHIFRNGSSISVRDTSKDVGQQVFMRGLSGIHWTGGQASCHGGARNTALITLKNVNMATFDGVDVEDMIAYSLSGDQLTLQNFIIFANETSGAAIVADNCVSLAVKSLNVYSINAPAVLKVMNNPGMYEYSASTPETGFAYTVLDLSSPSNGIGACVIHPYAIVNGNGVSPIAFASASNKDTVSSIIHHESGNSDYSVNWNSNFNLWQNGACSSTNGYLLKYLQSHDQNLEAGENGHLYNEFIFPTQVFSSSPNDYAKWLFAELIHDQEADGRFVLQALDSNNNVLSSQWHSPAEATHYPVSNWVRMKIPSGSKKIRFGFVNSKNYNGYIKSNYWLSSRYNDWHTTIYLVHDGNGVMRNKIRQNFSACTNEYRLKLPNQSQAIQDSTAADFNAVNLKINEMLSKLRESGSIKKI